ncbi:probable F-box protein At1g44080 [Corylus avellana]|uniref:probable F-box protein At1g44080 n=1 Tax=Corylus avellana TaxID=13451 RepID=UPI00286C7E63|nr:probable F-box protein At1g44080 [Corylus avellana]
MFLKPGDEEWTTFVNGLEKRMWVFDIICYKGGFCALDCNQNIIQFELSPVPRVKKKNPTRFNRSSHDPDEYDDDYEFLVESLYGDLLMVHVFWNLLETIKFKVYKLDSEKMEWDEIKSLGEEAIFLCCDGSACIRADDYTSLIASMISCMRIFGYMTWEMKLSVSSLTLFLVTMLYSSDGSKRNDSTHICFCNSCNYFQVFKK